MSSLVYERIVMHLRVFKLKGDYSDRIAYLALRGIKIWRVISPSGYKDIYL